MPFALRNSIVGDTEAMELSWACIFKIVSCASRRFLLISVYIDVQLYGSVICLTWEMASWKCFEKLVFEIHIDFRGVACDFKGVRKGEKVRREPFSIYGGEETMHLLMTTYRQDVMPIFHCSFSKSVYTWIIERLIHGIHKRTCQPKFYAKEQFYYVRYRSNFPWFWHKSHVCIRFTRVNFKQISFYSTGMICKM